MIDALGVEVPLSTSDGCTLHSRRWEVPHPRATVVLVHGFAASCAQPAVVAQAEALVARGYAVLSYDSRGHGESGGVCTLGDSEINDVAAAVERAGADGCGVLLVGASIGAVAVLRYAATGDERVQGVVAVSCPAAWRPPRTPQALLTMALTRTRFGRRLVTHHMKVRLSPKWTAPAPPNAVVGHIKVPVALIHGEEDRFIKPAEALEIYRRCRGPRRLDVVPGMGHAYDPFGIAAVSAAVDWVLEAPGLGPPWPVCPPLPVIAS